MNHHCLSHRHYDVVVAGGGAAGIAAALCSKQDLENVRQLDTQVLRQQLKAQGAIVDGIH